MKKENKNKVGIALVKELCRICLKEQDGPILMNQKLTEKEAEKVEDLHKKVIGYSKEPCENCKEYMKKGVMIILYDEEKTENIKNPWRTGHMIVLSEENIKKLIIDEKILKNVLEKRAMWMKLKDAMQVGLLKQEGNETSNNSKQKNPQKD